MQQLNIDWRAIRPWNGSQNSAFEELCCQLAAYENTPNGSEFIRKGAPDAGVECYWTLPTGDEWAWQAKYFLSRPGDAQWAQIDDSVKTALDKHPRLVQYIVCIPLDRQDPRSGEAAWFMDKWNDRVVAWKSWATAKNMSVEFGYWGSYELSERLTREDHHGRTLFWFNTVHFSDTWYQERLAEAIANAGPRYTKELNVELPIALNFEALGRTPNFFKRLEQRYGNAKLKYRRVIGDQINCEAGSSFDDLKRHCESVLAQLEQAQKTCAEPISWSAIDGTARKAYEAAWKCEEALAQAQQAYKEKTKDLPKSPDQREPSYDHAQNAHRELASELHEIGEYCGDSEAQLANTPALLLIGEAGTGKTHLFCDAASRHSAGGMPTVVLHGSHFDGTEPWSQILRILRLDCSSEMFLGALQAHAEARHCRAIILIDALNEGDGKVLWKNHLAGMLTLLSRYPRVAIAVSVRSSYKLTVIPPALLPARFKEITHHGFSGHEYEATQAFFAHYKIERPGIPILSPEFGRPLFLKLFCDALQKRGQTKVPPGLTGISSVFDFYLESINEKLAAAIDFDIKDKLVQKAVERIAQLMAEANTSWLKRDAAKEAVNAFLPNRDFQRSLFEGMRSEGLLLDNQRPISETECDIISFSYERFFDHRICSHLLNKWANPESLEESFDPEKPLGMLLKDENDAWMNRGVIEALAVQLPERYSKELVDVAPHCRDWQPVRQAVLESFLWRKRESFSDRTLKYVNDVLLKFNDSSSGFLQTVIMVSGDPSHPYNAALLHRNLKRRPLPKRDAEWSIFISSNFRQRSAIDRLVDWAWSDEDKTYVKDKSAFLCAVTLCWFFTSPNRYLRDAATKALINFLTPRIRTVRKLVRLFKAIDDPYLWERVLATAYGCAMRNADDAEIGSLAADIFHAVFSSGRPQPHILIRDYARGVIEVAVSRGCKLNIDIKLARPPYASNFPQSIPSEEAIKKYGERTDGMPEDEWSRVHIHSSVIGDMGDFARYVIGSDSRSKWRDRIIGKTYPPTAKEKYDQFIRSLSANEKKALAQYNEERNVRTQVWRLLSIDELKTAADGGSISTRTAAALKSISKTEASAAARFRKALTKAKQKEFDDEIASYIQSPSKQDSELDVSIRPMQRWIIQRVMDLGWTVERFGKFDRNLKRYGADYSNPRTGHKAERIGKKYQWIAFYEMLALMSDRYELKSDRYSIETEPFSGPWQFSSTRNIDPSFVLKSSKRVQYEDWAPSWWSPISYEEWTKHKEHVDWVKDRTDLPDPKGILEVVDPNDGSRWLVLSTAARWRQPAPIGEESFESKTRQIWCAIQAHLVKRKESKAMFKWARSQNFWGNWMPDPKSGRVPIDGEKAKSVTFG